MTTTVIQPYEHDCEACEWVGWLCLPDGTLANVYLHDKTVVIRHSDEPSDYWSSTALKGAEPHPITLMPS